MCIFLLRLAHFHMQIGLSNWTTSFPVILHIWIYLFFLFFFVFESICFANLWLMIKKHQSFINMLQTWNHVASSYTLQVSQLYFTSNRLPVAEFSSKLTLDMYASDFDSIFVLMIKFCFYLLRSQVGKSLLWPLCDIRWTQNYWKTTVDPDPCAASNSRAYVWTRQWDTKQAEDQRHNFWVVSTRSNFRD